MRFIPLYCATGDNERSFFIVVAVAQEQGLVRLRITQPIVGCSVFLKETFFARLVAHEALHILSDLTNYDDKTTSVACSL